MSLDSRENPSLFRFNRFNLTLLRHNWLLAHDYAWHCALFVVLGLVATLIEGLGIGLMIPLLHGSVPTSGSAGWLLHWLNPLVNSFDEGSRNVAILGMILAAMTLKGITSYAYTALLYWISNRVQFNTRNKMYSLILDVSQDYLESKEQGGLLRALSVGPKEASQSVATLLWLILNICTVLVFSLLLMALSWQLVLIVATALLLLSALVRVSTRRVRQLGSRGLDEDNTLVQRVKETLLGTNTIRAFGRETYERQRFKENSERARRLHLHRDLLLALAHPLTEFLAAIVLVMLVYLALNAGVQLAVLAAMAFMLLRLQPQIQNANANLATLASLDSQVVEVVDLMETGDKPSIRSGSQSLSRPVQGVRFENVGHCYAGRKRALSHIDLLVRAGHTTALVGRSGAGKSSLINLLCRFRDPTEGRISVDGTDLRALDLAVWRERIALVSQDVHIFSDTVRENIRYGRLGADDAAIQAAAVSAHAHDFIMELPMGYDTRVGERGVRLSGGQRQRLSIARAILRDPDILVLDEATNSLDSLSEAHIQAAIEELGKGRTLLVVAHRLSSIQKADHIVVLDAGRIIEQGEFAELMARNGLFAQLFGSGQKTA